MKKALLRADEKIRFAKEVDEALLHLGVPMIGSSFVLSAKLTALKQTLTDKNELTSDFQKFQVDTSKYFKKQSEDFDILSMLDN
jgi:hypothetical protein